MNFTTITTTPFSAQITFGLVKRIHARIGNQKRGCIPFTRLPKRI